MTNVVNDFNMLRDELTRTRHAHQAQVDEVTRLCDENAQLRRQLVKVGVAPPAPLDRLDESRRAS